MLTVICTTDKFYYFCIVIYLCHVEELCKYSGSKEKEKNK